MVNLGLNHGSVRLGSGLNQGSEPNLTIPTAVRTRGFLAEWLALRRWWLRPESGWCCSVCFARNPKLYLQKGVVGGCNYRWMVVCATMRTAAGRWMMGAMDKRQDGASFLTGHQDHTPNSDAARLRLDHPTFHWVSGCGQAALTHQSRPSRLQYCITCSSQLPALGGQNPMQNENYALRRHALRYILL
jgi:hypothetical protein